MGEIGNLEFKTEIWIWFEYLKFENKAENCKRKRKCKCMYGSFLLGRPISTPSPTRPSSHFSPHARPNCVAPTAGALGHPHYLHAGPTASACSHAVMLLAPLSCGPCWPVELPPCRSPGRWLVGSHCKVSPSPRNHLWVHRKENHVGRGAESARARRCADFCGSSPRIPIKTDVVLTNPPSLFSRRSLPTPLGLPSSTKVVPVRQASWPGWLRS
jgi:hypothetical protein